MKKKFINLLFAATFILLVSNTQVAFAQEVRDNNYPDSPIVDDLDEAPDVNNDNDVNNNNITGDNDNVTDDNDVNNNQDDGDFNANEYNPDNNGAIDRTDDGIYTTQNDDTENDVVDVDDDEDNDDVVENASYGVGGAALGGALTYFFLRSRRLEDGR